MSVPLPLLRPVDDAYAVHEQLVRRTAGRFARRHRLPFDDVLAEANYHFLRAVRGHDPAKGTVQARIVYKIWHGLMDWHRQSARRAVRMPCVDYDPNLVGACVREKFDPDALAVGIGRDGRTVLKLLADAPASLWAVLRSLTGDSGGAWGFARRYTGGTEARKLVREYLSRLGWDDEKTEAAFADITMVLT